MSGESLVEVRDEGPVRWLVLNRPDARNALDAKLVGALKDALDDAATSSARLIALAGAGKAFSAGADLKALSAMRTATLEENEGDSQHLAELFEKIVRQPQPLVAAVHGPAIAGGAGLAVACDLTIASESARFGFTEVRIGFVPAIVLNFLLRAVGEKVARDLCLTGRIVSAREALELGLINRIVPAAGLKDEVARLGAEIALTSPAAAATTRELIAELRHLPLEEGLRLAAMRNARARLTEECQEGVSAFLSKRKPTWQTDWPDQTNPSNYRSNEK